MNESSVVVLGDDEGMTTIDEILASLGPDPQAGGTPMQSLVLSHAQQRAIERSLQMTDPSPAAGAIPDYAAAEKEFVGRRRSLIVLDAAIDVACKPLTDRIAELQARITELETRNVDENGYLARRIATLTGERAERRNANVTASLKFACGCRYVGREPVPAYEVVQPGHIRPCSKHGPQVIVRVTTRLAQRGDTDA